MRRGMDKTLAALACAILIGALGALSWHSDQELGMPSGEPACNQPSGARDSVIYEIEKIHSVWGNHDTGRGERSSAAGNP